MTYCRNVERPASPADRPCDCAADCCTRTFQKERWKEQFEKERADQEASSMLRGTDDRGIYVSLPDMPGVKFRPSWEGPRPSVARPMGREIRILCLARKLEQDPKALWGFMGKIEHEEFVRALILRAAKDVEGGGPGAADLAGLDMYGGMGHGTTGSYDTLHRCGYLRDCRPTDKLLDDLEKHLLKAEPISPSSSP